jgi:hypothetical protein
MNALILGVPALALVLFQHGCDFESMVQDSQRYREDFQYTFNFKPGGSLVVENFNGPVEILSWEKDAVQITGTKYASTQDTLREIRIETKAEGNTVRAYTVRPEGWRGNMGARYSIRVPRAVQLERIVSSNGQIRVEDIDGSANLRTSNAAIRVHKLTGRLEATTSNGGIDADSLDNDATVRTSNGSVRLERVNGSAQAQTSNASITVAMARPKAGQSMTFGTSNGSIDLSFENLAGPLRASTSNSSITVRLPGSAKADVRASTSNASITSELEVTTRGAFGKGHMEGTVNGGGPLVDLTTTNASIRLLRM